MKKIKIKEEILNELIKIIYSDLIKKNYISKKYCNTDLISNDLSKSSEIKEKFNTLLIPVYKILENLPYTMSLGEEELDMRFTQPKRYSLTLNGNIHTEEVKVWKVLYKKVLEKLSKNYKINDSYTKDNASTDTLIYKLRKLFKELGIDFKNLEIEYSFEKLEIEKLI